MSTKPTCDARFGPHTCTKEKDHKQPDGEVSDHSDQYGCWRNEQPPAKRRLLIIDVVEEAP